MKAPGQEDYHCRDPPILRVLETQRHIWYGRRYDYVNCALDPIVHEQRGVK